MNEIVKVCQIHGELTADKARKDKSGKYYQWRCKQCRAETNKRTFEKYREKKMKYIGEWKKANRPKINAREVELRKLNPERTAAMRDREKNRYRTDGGRRSEGAIANKRGITREQYREMLLAQNNVCAICEKPESRMFKGKAMRLTLDHCHKTGKTRQFLCHMCNIGLGAFDDDVNRMLIAIEYLKRHE